MGVCDYEYDEERMRLRINCVGCLYGSSIEDYEECMARTIDKILEVKKVTSIVLAKNREYEYDYEQTKLLLEIAKVIEEVIRSKLLSKKNLGHPECEKCYPGRVSKLHYIVIELLRRDPIGAYVEVIREIRVVNVKLKRSPSRKCYDCIMHYRKVLDVLKQKLEATQMIAIAKPYTAGYHIGNRSVYRQIFSPSVRPNFMLTRYMITPPEGGRSVDRYKVGDTQIEIFKIPGQTGYFYYAIPPEFRLSEDKYSVLDAARKYMAAHKPKSVEFVKSKNIRDIFYSIGKDMIREMADSMGVSLSLADIEQISVILTRYTAGLGVLEVLLADEKIQDIYINSPVENQPIMIYHQDWEECKTNLIPSIEDAESWATRLRIHSGRPLDEANPVLDTDVSVPGGNARFCAITRTLSPHGIGFAIRRHRDKPWTLPLFVKSKMLNSTAAGLLSFLIDGAVSILVAGGRGAGKTSVLGSMMLEMLPKIRIVTIEDSVTGDAEIVYQNGGEMKIGTVGELIDNMVDNYGGEKIIDRDILASNPKEVKVFAMDKNGKVVLAPVSRFIRHKVDKDMYEIVTETGRKISVTCDHSLFTMGHDGTMASVKAKNLRQGSFIVAPRILNFEREPTEHVDLLEHLGKTKGLYITGEQIKGALKGRKWNRICREEGYSRPTLGHWRRNGIIPDKLLPHLDISVIDVSKLSIKAKSQSKAIPARIMLDEDFLSFVGLWLADGCYDKHSVIVSACSEEERGLCRRIADRFGIPVKTHSDEFSLMLNSTVLKRVMKDILALEGDAYTKHIPAWVFRLSKEQIGWVLRGLFSGDGCASDKEVILSLCSEQMVRDVQTLLLAYGVIFRIGGFKERDKTWRGSISSLKSLRAFRDNVNFLPGKKRSRLDKLCGKTSTHDTTDVIPLPAGIKEELASACRSFNKQDYITRGNQMGREKLKRLLEEIPENKKDLKGTISSLANSDIYWDRIRAIRCERKSQYVYDFSVPGYENFVCNNILAHNTLELPVDQLKDLHYNIERLKSRSVITRVETEMPADEALRTALRLGDSALIVGEVRSTEAKALYEAMRIGALSNVVAGTIHGESAYGVYDRDQIYVFKLSAD
ncbi:MAG: ATPase, T2SS/T4P/T4SS family [Candidatus Aenigmarchaeota archaeon]|nr:ATPase, T2SS/T4P/T4SS family [Candidatus Aenigmarchaeota archaeon]